MIKHITNTLSKILPELFRILNNRPFFDVHVFCDKWKAGRLSDRLQLQYDICNITGFMIYGRMYDFGL